MSHDRLSLVPPREEPVSYVGFDSNGWYFLKREPVSRPGGIDPAIRDFRRVLANRGLPGSLEFL